MLELKISILHFSTADVLGLVRISTAKYKERGNQDTIYYLILSEL